MQFYLPARSAPPMPPTSSLDPPLGPPIFSKSTRNCSCARSVRKGARKSDPERERTDLWGPKGAKRCQNGAKLEPKMCLKSRFQKKVPKVVWTHYLLYILTTGTLQKPHFLTPRSKQNAGLFHVVPRILPGLQSGAHGAEKGREWGPPGAPRVPKGPPMPPKMLPKIVENRHSSPGLPPRLLLGCLGYPNSPKIRPFSTFPRPVLPHVRGNVHLLSAAPHPLAPSHCEASLERGGLGVCPLGLHECYMTLLMDIH